MRRGSLALLAALVAFCPSVDSEGSKPEHSTHGGPVFAFSGMPQSRVLGGFTFTGEVEDYTPALVERVVADEIDVDRETVEALTSRVYVLGSVVLGGMDLDD